VLFRSVLVSKQYYFGSKIASAQIYSINEKRSKTAKNSVKFSVPTKYRFAVSDWCNENSIRFQHCHHDALFVLAKNKLYH